MMDTVGPNLAVILRRQIVLVDIGIGGRLVEPHQVDSSTQRTSISLAGTAALRLPGFKVRLVSRFQIGRSRPDSHRDGPQQKKGSAQRRPQSLDMHLSSPLSPLKSI